MVVLTKLLLFPIFIRIQYFSMTSTDGKKASKEDVKMLRRQIQNLTGELVLAQLKFDNMNDKIDNLMEKMQAMWKTVGSNPTGHTTF